MTLAWLERQTERLTRLRGRPARSGPRARAPPRRAPATRRNSIEELSASRVRDTPILHAHAPKVIDEGDEECRVKSQTMSAPQRAARAGPRTRTGPARPVPAPPHAPTGRVRASPMRDGLGELESWRLRYETRGNES